MDRDGKAKYMAKLDFLEIHFSASHTEEARALTLADGTCSVASSNVVSDAGAESENEATGETGVVFFCR